MKKCGVAMPPKVGEVCELLRGMPIEDQLAIVLIAIEQANPGALSVSLCMLRAIVKLSERLSDANRFKISEALRDAADALERPLVEATPANIRFWG
jgi:hypothetical protein